MMRAANYRSSAAAAAALLLAGCQGPQNILDVAGEQAERIAGLWYFLVAVTTVVWILVVLTKVEDPTCARVGGATGGACE